jgi:hypothetical protein
LDSSRLPLIPPVAAQPPPRGPTPWPRRGVLAIAAALLKVGGFLALLPLPLPPTPAAVRLISVSSSDVFFFSFGPVIRRQLLNVQIGRPSNTRYVLVTDSYSCSQISVSSSSPKAPSVPSTSAHLFLDCPSLQLFLYLSI